jgi:hypothetical protein
MGLALWPALVVVAVAGAAAAWVFRLRVRPPRVAVPSLALWQLVLDQKRELSWWERVRWFVSLAGTVLVAVLLALAAVRPVWTRSAGTGGAVLLVLDSSWSMRARTSDGRTRWDWAVSEARRQARAEGGAVVLATTADGIVEGPTDDLALIETALGRVSPTADALDAWPELRGTAAVHFFTDGALRRYVPADAVVHAVFEPAPNVAITAFAARPPTSAAGSAEVYLEIGNFATAPQTIDLVVSRGSERLVERSLNVGAGEAVRQVLPIELDGDPRLRATVRARQNALDIDDAAVSWLAEADPFDVTVLGKSPSIVTSLLERDASLRVRARSPSDYDPAAADVFVFDGWLPPEPPIRPALILDPASGGWLGTPGAIEPAPAWVVAREHPVISGVDPATLTIARTISFEAPRLTPIAVSAGGAPLITVDDGADRRLVVFTFAPAESNLAASPAFPVLVGNAVHWLGRPVLAEPGPPGRRVLPAGTTQVLSPSGAEVPLLSTGDRVIARLDAPGLYLGRVGGAPAVAAVNALSPVLSNLLVSEATSERGTVAPAGWMNRWWMYVVMAALVLVTIEWFTWLRRITV